MEKSPNALLPAGNKSFGDFSFCTQASFIRRMHDKSAQPLIEAARALETAAQNGVDVNIVSNSGVTSTGQSNYRHLHFGIDNGTPIAAWRDCGRPGYDGGEEWTSFGRVGYEMKVMALALYNSKIYLSTLPMANVWRLDDEVLRLFMDGEMVAQSSPFNAADFDLNTQEPLKIGFGPHEFFKGTISDLRLYRGALTAEEIRDL